VMTFPVVWLITSPNNWPTVLGFPHVYKYVPSSQAYVLTIPSRDKICIEVHKYPCYDVIRKSKDTPGFNLAGLITS